MVVPAGRTLGLLPSGQLAASGSHVAPPRCRLLLLRADICLCQLQQSVHVTGLCVHAIVY